MGRASFLGGAEESICEIAEESLQNDWIVVYKRKMYLCGISDAETAINSGTQGLNTHSHTF